MNTTTILRQQMNAMHGYLDRTIMDCSPEALGSRTPGATINSPGAIYAHTIFAEDGILNGMVRSTTPVYLAGGWSDRIKVPFSPGQEPDWDVSVPVELFREYATAVRRTTDEYLASASDEEMARVVDLGFMPPVPIATLVADVLVWHTASHQGEISALKGAQGLVGLAQAH